MSQHCKCTEEKNPFVLHTMETMKTQQPSSNSVFNHLFDFLSCYGKSILIPIPIPTMGSGVGRFSRLLNFHSWLKATGRAHDVGLLTIFWYSLSLFRRDRLHPNKLGSQVLATSIHHVVQFTTGTAFQVGRFY